MMVRDLHTILKHLEIDAARLMVNELRLDSRDVEAGDVFVAIKGHLLDGGHFISKAIENGASAIIADRLCEFESHLMSFYYRGRIPVRGNLIVVFYT